MGGDLLKTIHMASKVNSKGSVSAACFTIPRKINLARESWTLRADAVTCPKCKAWLKESAR